MAEAKRRARLARGWGTLPVTISRRLGLLGWIGLIFLVSAGGWLFGHSWLLTREVAIPIESAEAPRQWALLWQGRRGQPENGAWIDAKTLMAPQTLELILPGRRPDETAFRLWLDEIRGSAPGSPAINLRALLGTEALTGRWQEFGSGGGIVFVGPQQGSLKVQVPGGGVGLMFARTQEGGGFVARYATGVERLDCYAEPSDRTRVALEPARAELAIAGEASLRLPSYDLATLRLAWLEATGARAIIGQPRVRTRLLNFTIRDEVLGVVGGTPRGDGSVELTLDGGDAAALPLVAGAREPAGVVELEAPRALGVGWHLLGVGALFAGALALGVVGFVLVVILSFGRPRWLGVGFLVLLLVIGVRLWLGSWAPVLYLPDSIDYTGGGVNWLNGESLDSFRPVRVPGYAVFIGLLWQLPWTLNTAIAVSQGLLGVLTALCAWSITRRLVGRGWGALAFLVVGLDPVLLAWERCAMSESLAAFLVTLLAWMLVRNRKAGERRAQDRVDLFGPGPRAGGASDGSGGGDPRWEPRAGERKCPSFIGWLLLSLLAGALVAAGSYVRGNFQVLAPLLPVLLVLEARRRFGLGRSLILGAACFAVAVGLLVPHVLANKRDFGVASFMVASKRNQFILAEPHGLMDMNHTRAIDFPQWRELSEKRAAHEIHEWNLAAKVMGSKAPVAPEITSAAASKGNPAVVHPGVEEARYKFFVEESFARRGMERLKVSGAAMGNLLGLYPWSKRPGFQENEYWTRPLRGIDLTRGSNFYTDLAHAMKYGRGGEAVYRASQRDITRALRSTDAKIFNEWFIADRALRPIYAGLMLVGLAAALIRREWSMAWMGAVVVLHAGALAVLATTGIDRYGVPFEPLLRIGSVYGLAVVVGWWGHGMRRDAQGTAPL